MTKMNITITEVITPSSTQPLKVPTTLYDTHGSPVKAPKTDLTAIEVLERQKGIFRTELG